MITSVCFTVRLLNGEYHRRRLRTPPRMQLLSQGVEALLAQEAQRVEQYFPGREFRLVPLRNGDFNFVEVRPELASNPAESGYSNQAEAQVTAEGQPAPPSSLTATPTP